MQNAATSPGPDEPTMVVTDLAAFIDRSPSPLHAVATVADRLVAAGWRELAETDAWSPTERGFVRRGGAVVAWRLPADVSPVSPVRLVGAHTDSPNLRIKPRPETGSAGVGQLGVEVYGGVLLNSWLDRDLGVSGRVVVRGADGPEERLVLIDRPVLRVSQLAIHLDREVNERGLLLDRQRHLAPMWCDGAVAPGAFAAWVAAEIAVDAGDVLAWDLMLHDLQPGAFVGRDGQWFASARIDNLVSCHAATQALIGSEPRGAISMMCLFDHEEVGSTSSTGADGALLPVVLRRLCGTLGGGDEEMARSLAASVCVSADGAHATHPNYAERHEPEHRIALNGGPVIKRNANERYATAATGHAIAVEACRAAGVPHQVFVNRTDLACGSTIGPVTSARLGITTVDMGVAQLSMHSARELCGADDPGRFLAALEAFLGGA